MTPVRERSIETRRGRMGWLEAGEGWPVVLLHGFPLSAGMWRPQLEAVPSGWRLIAPGLRGFSDGPPVDRPVSMDEYASDVRALLDALEIDRAVIGGVSMGGYITFALFRQEPTRFTAMVLADTRAQADTPAGRDARRQMRTLVERDGARGVADQMLPKLLSPDAPSATVAAVRTMIETTDRAAIDAAIVALMDRPDSTPVLARINVPTLVLVGDADPITPVADAETMQHAIARSQLVVVPQAGHLSNLEQPDVFSRALADFLASAL
jgi:pimeloyl-ACP methyl ester carboxylesterase